MQVEWTYLVDYCLWRVGRLRWSETLTAVPAVNKAYHLSSVNHFTKATHHHHHHSGLVYPLKLMKFPN